MALIPFFVLHCLLFAFVRALPVKLESRDVQAALLSDLSYLSQYAAAAYCPGNNQQPSSTAITCSAGNCPVVQSAGASALVEFQNIGLTDATGFVAVDHTNGLLVIAFRGSKSVRNWLTSLDIAMNSWGMCEGCQVHSGFLDSWNEAKPIIQPVLDSAITQWPSYTVIMTGHSLGAAIATVGAGELRTQGYKISLYTYGSPMVGNIPFASFITSQGSNYRVTHQEDVVPKLPGYLLGFAHVSSEYWVKSGDNAPVTTKDIAVSSGVIDFSGNQGTFGSSISNHDWYFGAITKCAPSGLQLKKV